MAIDTEIIVNGKCVGKYDMIPDDNRPDLEQSDDKAPNYVHNRPMYCKDFPLLCSTEVDLISKSSGYTFKADVDDSTGTLYLLAETLKKYRQSYAPTLRIAYYDTNFNRDYAVGYVLNNALSVENMLSTQVSGPDSKYHQNLVCTVKRGTDTIFYIYVVMNDTLLEFEDKYAGRFDGPGVYIELVNLMPMAAKYYKVSLKTKLYSTMNMNFLPLNDSVLEIPAATASDAGKVLMVDSTGKPVWATLPTTGD